MSKSKSAKIALSSTLVAGALFFAAVEIRGLDNPTENGMECENDDGEPLRPYACSKLGYAPEDSVSTVEDTMDFILTSKKEAEEKRVAEHLAYKKEHERRVEEAKKKRLAEIEAEKARLAKLEEEKRLAKIEEERLATLEQEREKRREARKKEKETQIVSRGGDYIGQAQTYTATAYTAYCEGCGGITKTGHNLRASIYQNGRRVIAVDPNRIPLGSIVQVTLSNGTSFEAVASDIGGDIKKNRIDVAHNTKDEAYRFGRQDVTVRMIQRGGS